MPNRDGGVDGTAGSRGPGGPFDRCWRCRDQADALREVSHPDSAIDRNVQVCATGCWLPDSATYRCHECDEQFSREQIRLVRAPTRADLRPECLGCNRAVLRDTESD